MTQLSNTQCYLYKTIPHIQQLGRSDKWSTILKRNKEGSTFRKHHCLTAHIFSIWNISQATSITKAARGCDSRLLMLVHTYHTHENIMFRVAHTHLHKPGWNNEMNTKNTVFIYCPGDTVTLDYRYSAFVADKAVLPATKERFPRVCRNHQDIVEPQQVEQRGSMKHAG